MSYSVAGIDIHKQILMVAVADVTASDGEFDWGRFGSTRSEWRRLISWLAERSVQEVVMESTAQYWRPVWLELEPHFRLHLAQAKSNRDREVESLILQTAGGWSVVSWQEN